MMKAAPFHAEVAAAPAGARSLWLTTADDVRIRMVAWTGGARGTAYIFPGRTEYAEKYGRVAAEWVARGFSVAVIDWRGQGLSDRRGRTPMAGHVGDFGEFQHDVAAALVAAEALGLPGPAVLLAHSMGGCIGLRTLMEREVFRGAIMCAPMWRLQIRTGMREIASKAIRAANALGLHRRVSMVSSTDPEEASDRFEGNALTSDREMFAWVRGQVAAHPELALGPPDRAWTQAAFAEMIRLKLCRMPAIPLLVFAGSDERVVSVAKIRGRVRHFSDAVLVEFAGGRHELLMEREEIRRSLWTDVDAFIARLGL